MINVIDFYNGIFKRKSIRKYKNEPIESSKMDSLESFIKELTPLYNNIKTEVVILPENEIKTILPIKSPHYVALYSEAKDGYLVNAGYMLQQVDLFLSINGIGACWLGMGVPQKLAASRNGLEFVITLAFGEAMEPLYRESITEFKRKPLSEISSLEGVDEILEAGRLAPSASNTQSWYFTGNADNIILSRKLPNLIKAALYGKYNQVDMGIALFHLRVAALYMGKTVQFIKENTGTTKGYEYVTTVRIQ